LFGGIAFCPEPAPGPPWEGFANASFTLPRCVYLESEGEAFARIAYRAEELWDAARTAVDLDRALALFAPVAADEEEEEGPGCLHTALPERGGGAVEIAGPSPERWAATVTDALACIESGRLEKVVAATTTQLRTVRAIDPAEVVESLLRTYPACSSFAIPRGSRTFVGASPERLVRVLGTRVDTEALAGTLLRRHDETGTALLASEKDRREHELVARAIRHVMTAVCSEVAVADEPIIRTLANVHHLYTPMTGRLRRRRHILELVDVLHPTPAVCGHPRAAAFEWIAKRETLPRGWYAGAVGWFDAAGDGDFAVAIRSGLLELHEAWLFAGAGIVRGSDPARELLETRMKQAPLLHALGAAR
jgi:menaquinone-specific isochorismate synthase